VLVLLLVTQELFPVLVWLLVTQELCPVLVWLLVTQDVSSLNGSPPCAARHLIHASLALLKCRHPSLGCGTMTRCLTLTFVRIKKDEFPSSAR
jgi:hypothetical protein